MATEYEQRYGGSFRAFMNAVEPELLDGSVNPPAPAATVRLVYVGALYLNRWRSLLDIATAVDSLRGEGHQVETVIHTQTTFSSEAKRLHRPPSMRFAGSLAPLDVLPALTAADILIHVESFDHATVAYTRLSVSSKLPEYLCAGRPIFAYGPADLASIRMIRESGAGVVVATPNVSLLKESLRQLVASRDLRLELGRRGRAVAAAHHNAAVQREHFRHVLAAATAPGLSCP